MLRNMKSRSFYEDFSQCGTELTRGIVTEALRTKTMTLHH